jgi:hypothetical protein
MDFVYEAVQQVVPKVHEGRGPSTEDPSDQRWFIGETPISP